MSPRTLTALSATLLMWSSAFAGLRYLRVDEGLPAGHVVLARFIAATVPLLILAAALRLKLPRLRDLPAIAVLGLIGIAIYHVALTVAIGRVTAGAASLLIAFAPAFTALIARVYLRERLSVTRWIGLGIGFSGVTLITFGAGREIGFDSHALLVLLSALCTSLFFVFQKPLFARYSPLELSTWCLLAGTLWLLVFADGFGESMARVSPTGIATLIYIGSAAAGLGYALWAYALKRLPASVLTTTLYINPSLAIGFGFIVNGEVPTPLTIVGGVVTIAGVMIVVRSASPRGPA
jgi:drug/metabolite transporter (DMT)-like permease